MKITDERARGRDEMKVRGEVTTQRRRRAGEVVRCRQLIIDRDP